MEEAVLKSSMQRCQSDLKSGVMDPGRKNFDFSRQISEKFRFSMAISKKLRSLQEFRFFETNFRFFQENFKKIQFFQEILKKFDFQATIAHSYFWANYSISLQKSPLSNLLPVHDKI